ARVRDGLAENGAVEIRPTDDGDVPVGCEDHRGTLAAAGNFDGPRARVQDLKLARFERRVRNAAAREVDRRRLAGAHNVEDDRTAVDDERRVTRQADAVDVVDAGVQ